MPLSDWQAVPLVTTGDMWTAAQHNTYVRQNQQALYDGITAHEDDTNNPHQVTAEQVGAATQAAFDGLFVAENVADTSVDWNDLTTPGISDYLIFGSNPNGPGSASYYYCIVYVYNNKSITQFAIPYSNSAAIHQPIWYRGRYLGTWSAWQQVWVSGQIQHISGTGDCVRYPDGLQICWATFNIAAGDSVPWTFPAAFVATPSTTGGSWEAGEDISNGSATSVTVQHSASSNRYVHVTAVGFWK